MAAFYLLFYLIDTLLYYFKCVCVHVCMCVRCVCVYVSMHVHEQTLIEPKRLFDTLDLELQVAAATACVCWELRVPSKATRALNCGAIS